jgi:hypothetical protein
VADTNPADAPYPHWSPAGDYPSGYKVVENGEIYQARWSNQGVAPQAQSGSPADSPWKARYQVPGEPA